MSDYHNTNRRHCITILMMKIMMNAVIPLSLNGRGDSFALKTVQTYSVFSE